MSPFAVDVFEIIVINASILIVVLVAMMLHHNKDSH